MRPLRCLGTILAVFVVLIGASPAVGAGPEVGGAPIDVAVFDDSDLGSSDEALADVLNADPAIRAHTVTRAFVEQGGLAPTDCVVVRVLGPPDADGPTAATVRALREFVASGGGFIGEHWGGGGALAGPAPSFDGDYLIPERFFRFFNGRASDGGFVRSNNPIRVISEHPVTNGLPDVFAAEFATEFFVRPVSPYDPELTVLALYSGHGGVHPAIMTGPSERPAVLMFFDAMDNPTDPELSVLWFNSVRWACSPR